MTNDETFPERPIPKRLETGWLAWQATIGYIYHVHSQDAVLTLTAYLGSEAEIGWSASLTWGEHIEAVHDETLLATALRELWLKIEDSYTIFLTPEAAIRRPIAYGDDDWLEEPTQIALDRLLQMTTAALGANWRFLITYQPVDDPNQRILARLFDSRGNLLAEAHGSVLREVCQLLYRNAARFYAARDR